MEAETAVELCRDEIKYVPFQLADMGVYIERNAGYGFAVDWR